MGNVGYINLCLNMSKIDPNPPRQIIAVKNMYEEYDVFICHASEDKKHIATPMYNSLISAGITAFIDNQYIKWGDSFVEKINRAIARAKLVLVILSKNSVDKKWPKKEINAAIARDIEGKTKILQLMVGSHAEVEVIKDKLVLLADRHYKKWSNNPDELACEIKDLLNN